MYTYIYIYIHIVYIYIYTHTCSIYVSITCSTIQANAIPYDMEPYSMMQRNTIRHHIPLRMV